MNIFSKNTYKPLNVFKMKIKFLIFSLLIITYFTSCTLEGESNYTPEIIFLRNPVTQAGDSLLFYYTDESGVYRMDTIQVGDTVHFYIYLYAYENNLTAFYLKESADSVTKIILPSKTSMDSVFLTTSDYSTGKFLMNGTATSLYFPFRYVAKSASSEAKIQLTVVSDANFKDSWGTNSATVIIKTPIVENTDPLSE